MRKEKEKACLCEPVANQKHYSGRLCSAPSSVRLLEGVTNRASVLSEEVKEHLETLSS